MNKALLMRKLIVVVGLVGALLAAEGLTRLSSLAGAFSGGDAPFYIAMLIISVVAAGVLLVSLFRPIAGWVKGLSLFGLICSAGLMVLVQNFPVSQQVLIGVVLALVTLATPRLKRP